MIKQYKLRFYNFRLVVFLLAISAIGVLLVGTARDQAAVRRNTGRSDHVDPLPDGLLLDLKFPVAYVWF